MNSCGVGSLGLDSIWMHMVLGPFAQIPHEFLWSRSPGPKEWRISYKYDMFLAISWNENKNDDDNDNNNDDKDNDDNGDNDDHVNDNNGDDDDNDGNV